MIDKRFFITCLLFGATMLNGFAQDGPVVTTDMRYARGATMAFGRMTATGQNIVERGFCWAETPEPTVDDHKTVKYLSNNGNIYWLQDLTPATLYYMRAYAIDKAGNVGYGDVIRFYTIPKGQIKYTIRDGGTDAVKTRITNAVDKAVGYWNDLTSITGFSTNVGYDASVPTADCSYGGWVRVGSNESYQRTGTILHELLHGVGVIPWADTEWSRHNLRSSVTSDGYGTGYWLGDRVTEVVRFLDNSKTEMLNGDYQHMWPYGINGAHEDNGTDLLYIGNGLVCQALGEDGLQHSSTSFSRPYYSFQHQDDEKYYIKNESDERGLYSSFLVPTKTGSLVWRSMTAAEAAANDSVAWTMSFTPSNQYYQLRNVATGRYMSYSATGTNGIKTAETATPANSENFQLMRGRDDVSVGNETTGQRGYWLIHPESNWQPYCLQADKNGAVSASQFNIASSASPQRWLILSAGEMNEMETFFIGGVKSQITDALATLQTLVEVPHIEEVAGTDASVNSTISRVNDLIASSNSIEELVPAEEEIRTAISLFLNGVSPTDPAHPFDITYMLANPGMDSAEGWSVAPTINYSCGEFYQKTFDMNQSLANMPLGTYRVSVRAFQRPGTSAEAWSNYTSGKTSVTAFLYAGNKVQRLANICSDASESKLGGKESSVGSSPVMYVPNDMNAASIYFSNGLYDNSVVTELTKSGSSLKLGVRSANMGSNYWCIFDDFRLYFYGKMSKEDVTGIDNVTVEDNPGLRQGVYTLDGRKIDMGNRSIDSLPKGIYVVNGKKFAK